MTTGEKELFVEFYNAEARNFADCKGYTDLTVDNIFDKLSDGVLFARLMNVVDKSTLPGRLIKSPAGDDAAKAANFDGIKKVFDKKLKLKDVPDFKSNQHEYTWLVLKGFLMKDINLVENTAIIRSLEKGEGLDTLLNLDNAGIILRWANYHLMRAGKNVTVSSVEKDFADVDIVATIVSQCHKDSANSNVGNVVSAGSKDEKISILLESLKSLGLDRFLSAEALLNNYWRVTFAFLANTFNLHLGMYLPSEEEMDVIMNEIRELAAKLARCEEECERLKEQLAILDTELDLLRSKKGDFDQLILQKQNLLEEKQQEYDRKEKGGDDEIQILQQKIKEKEDEINGVLKRIADLKAKHEEFVATSKKTIQDQVTLIEELKSKLEALEKKKSELSALVGGRGNEISEITEKLLEMTNTSNDKSRAIAEHLEKVKVKVNEWSENFTPAADIDIPVHDDEKKDLEATLAAQGEILEKYKTAIKELDEKFNRQKMDAKRRMDEINSLVSEYLGTDNADPGAAIANMKRLLELMIEKCKKQATQIAIYDATIEKMDDLNNLVKDKIAVLADANIDKKNKKKAKK